MIYRGEAERVNFDTKSRHVLLLELAGQVALDEGGLAEEKNCKVSTMPLILRRGTSPRPSPSRDCWGCRKNARMVYPWEMSFHTLPVPPSPTRTSLNVGVSVADAIVIVLLWVSTAGSLGRRAGLARKQRGIEIGLVVLYISTETPEGGHVNHTF
jgi:hypothetical protein